MSDGLSKLEEMIRGELVLGRRILTLVKSKREAIVKNDLVAIDSLTREANEAVDQFEELGFSRQEQVLAVSRGGPPLRATENLRDLVGQLGGETRTRLGELREDLHGLYHAIREESRANGELLSQSVRFTQHLFDRFSAIDRRVRQGRMNYDRSGGKRSAKAESAVFRKEG